MKDSTCRKTDSTCVPTPLTAGPTRVPQVFADLEPLSDSKVAVQFRVFKIFSLIPIQAPGRARGELH
jgi:hypothetical protein